MLNACIERRKGGTVGASFHICVEPERTRPDQTSPIMRIKSHALRVGVFSGSVEVWLFSREREKERVADTDGACVF